MEELRKYNYPKRDFKYGISCLLLMGILVLSVNKSISQSKGWDKVPELLKSITLPSFPDKTFSIVDYGAKADGMEDCLPAITKAISECNADGGGHVVIPEGTYFVKGPIHLKNDVDLHLEEGAILKFSTDPDDYLPVVYTRFEGAELMNYSPMVYAYGKENIAVTGKGILDDQASSKNWWSWRGVKRYGWKEGMPSQRDTTNRLKLWKMAAENVPVEERVFGKGYHLRPNFLETYRCNKVLIEGITIKNTPHWIIHPTLSQNVTIDGITIISHGPNNDGCDPESCENVLIKNSFFSNGDDCISIKSGKDQDGRRVNVPSKNIVVKDCEMRNGHGGVVIGSGTAGGIEEIYVQDCIMNSPQLNNAIRIKSNDCRGGVMKDLYFKDIQVEEVNNAVVVINMLYSFGERIDCHYNPIVENVQIDNVVSNKSKYAIYIQGLEEESVKPGLCIRISKNRRGIVNFRK